MPSDPLLESLQAAAPGWTRVRAMYERDRGAERWRLIPESPGWCAEVRWTRGDAHRWSELRTHDPHPQVALLAVLEMRNAVEDYEKQRQPKP